MEEREGETEKKKTKKRRARWAGSKHSNLYAMKVFIVIKINLYYKSFTVDSILVFRLNEHKSKGKIYSLVLD